MRDIECAEIKINTCLENHVHIRQTSIDSHDCPVLDTVMEPDEARRFACAVLEAANSLAPVS